MCSLCFYILQCLCPGLDFWMCSHQRWAVCLAGGRDLGCRPLVRYLQKLLILVSPLDFRYRKQKESVQCKGAELRLRSRLSPSPRKSQGRPDFRNGFFLEHSDSSPVQEELEKPSGKRKCKTKHLAGICDEGKVWLGPMSGTCMGRRERRGLLLVSHGHMCQGDVFLSFPGERLLEPAQNVPSEEARGLMDTL